MTCHGCGWDTSEGGATQVVASPESVDDLAYLVDADGRFVLDVDGRYITFSATENGQSFFDVTNQTTSLISCLPYQRIRLIAMSWTCDEQCTVEFFFVERKYKYTSGGAGHGMALSEEQLWTGDYGQSLTMTVSGMGKVSGRVVFRVMTW
jgi:hypothetical protein